MTREKLLEYTDTMLLERLLRLVRMDADEVEINNLRGMIEDRMMGIRPEIKTSNK